MAKQQTFAKSQCIVRQLHMSLMTCVMTNCQGAMGVFGFCGNDEAS